MNINYQIMDSTHRNIYGNYIPDFELLLENASCEEEKDFILSVEDRIRTRLNSYRAASAGFSFNMVYIVKQGCGHYELFQSPCNAYHPLETVLRQAASRAKGCCTKCICGSPKGHTPPRRPLSSSLV